MTISIPEQYQSLKTKLETIVKKTIIQYELTSTNYTPTINTQFMLVCDCKNVLGNPIANKQVTLFDNNVVSMTGVTDARGRVTFNVTLSDWNHHNFRVGNATLTLKASGETIRLIDSSQYGIIWSVNTETGVSMITYNNTQTINANSYVTVKNPYDESDANVKYCPQTSVYAPTSLSSIYMHVTWMGEIRLHNRSSSNVTSSNVQAGVSFVGKGFRGTSST